MTLGYLPRLACLCLAAFFVLHAVLAAAVSVAVPGLIRRAGRMRSDSASRFLLGFRLLPALGASLLVAALCVPSYLLLEPADFLEELGPACVAAALCGLVICVSSLVRTAAATVRSASYLRHCEDETAPVLLVAGVFRTRLVVSPGVSAALTEEEFEAALCHEEAHRHSKDNLKRLLISMTPDVLPLVRGFRKLDAAWQRTTEWAADDCAAQGSAERALALASALVRIGRMRAGSALPQAVSALLADPNELRVRVERLVEGETSDVAEPGRLLFATASIAVLATLAFEPQMLNTVHHFLEQLAH
jgi:Zn-dependent protease with chaperone function